MSGLWGYQTALDLFLKENGITTVLFSGVNSDQVKTKQTVPTIIFLKKRFVPH